MKMLHRLWADEAGFVVSTELVLVATTLAIGMIVGLTTVRDQVVQELGDFALAIGNVNQSYVYDGVTGHTSATAGSDFTDQTDFCEPADGDDQAGVAPACISVQEPSSDEGEAPSPQSL
jgi:Flp pilus assembly pilin Flp